MKPLATIACCALAGTVVGITSVGAGQLVGTDLVQAVPLGSVLVGAIPGVWAGALVSSRTQGALIRRVLAVVMLTSGVQLLGASTFVIGFVAVAASILIPVMCGIVRVRDGEAPTVWQQRRRERARAERLAARGS